MSRLFILKYLCSPRLGALRTDPKYAKCPVYLQVWLRHIIHLTTKETWHLLFVSNLGLNEIVVNSSFLCMELNYSRLRCIDFFKKQEQIGDVSDQIVTLPLKSKIVKL